MRGNATTVGALVAALVTTFVLGTATAAGKIFRVTHTNDPEPGACTRKSCSLREAVRAANATPARDTIVLPNRRRPYQLTRPGGDDEQALSGDLDILAPLNVVHKGKGFATIDANRLDRIFHAKPGAPLLLRKIVVRNGLSDGDGGGILTDANLRLVRSKVVGNESQGGDGGGVDLDADARLTMRRSVVARNVAALLSGGINTSGDGPSLIVRSRIVGNRAEGDEGGGIGLADGDDLRVVRSVISRNFADGDGGGIEANSSRLVVKRSTIAENTSQGDGGGIVSEDPDGSVAIDASTISGNTAVGGGSSGGGLKLDDAIGSIRNSTIAGNRANVFGGGVFVGDATLRLNAVTIARNVADPAVLIPGVVRNLAGGGVYTQPGAAISVENSLIALNTGSGEPNDCEGDVPIASLGHNLISTTSGGLCEGFDRPSDRVSANPRLGPLKRNGGPTATIALKRGSPAIDKASRRTAPKRDQRGRKRGKRPDIGAFERGA